MTADREGNDLSGPRTVPIDSVPDPVVGFDCSDGDAVVAETNDAFTTLFDGISAGDPVRGWLRNETAADESTAECICSSLTRGEAVDTGIGSGNGDDTAESGRYRLRTFEDRGDDITATTADDTAVDGYLLVTELESTGPESAEVDRIASIVSHDLRNPLDVANAHLRAARETGNEEHFDAVRESHERMERIVRDVLTLARGEQALDVATDVDPGAVAADAWGVVDTRGASLTIEDDLPRIDADRDRLQRLFENLFRNSVEHARHETEAQTASKAADDDERGRESDTDQSLQVRVGSTDGGLFVADDGPGIPADERERVFEPGYSGSEPGTGTGLGLTIVEQIAEAHDWTVSLTNGSLGGARFDFRPSSGTE